MARMFPNAGPVVNASTVAEPLVYRALAEQLSDDFIVIHSLPWLAQAARELNGRNAPTGQIDFLVLHPTLGILAVEVKGGQITYEHPSFVVKRTGEQIDPFTQLGRGVYVLPKWIKGAGGPSIIIGYAFVFPQSTMHGQPLPPLLIDNTAHPRERMIIDRHDLLHLDERIPAIMRYWKKALRTRDYTQDEIEEIVTLLCPVADYTPRWSERITDDQERWLILTAEQSRELQRLESQQRTIITGRSGTGKTLLALTRARQLTSNGENVLFLVYNNALAQRLTNLLRDVSIQVLTFYDLCRRAYTVLRRPLPDNPDDLWYHVDAPDALEVAISQNKLRDLNGREYTALIIDEAQVYSDGWLRMLTSWFLEKSVLVCCDDTQVFPFERYVTPTDLIAQVIDAPIRTLTVNVRSPRAVFERLEAALPDAKYQQYSPRDHEPDTLLEIVAPNPPAQLHKTLQELRLVGVPKKSIAVLYLGQAPNIAAETRLLIGELMPVARYRGLESPIVIIYIPDTKIPIESVTLSCAYGRATTGCIAIYPLQAFIPHPISPLLGEEDDSQHDFLQFVQSNPSTQAQVSEIWPITRALSMKTITKLPISINWSCDWGGWVVNSSDSPRIERTLWIRHLLHTTQMPCFTTRLEYPFNSAIHVYQPTRTLTRALIDKECPMRWCLQCERWTRHHRESPRSEAVCVECGKPKELIPLSYDPAKVKHDADILASPNRFSVEDKRGLSIFLITLGRWRKLTSEGQQHIEEYVSHDVTSGYLVAKLLTGMDVYHAQPGDRLQLDEVCTRYFRLSPWLQQHITRQLWEDLVERSLHAWSQHKWLRQIEPRLVYERIELPPPWTPSTLEQE